MLLKNLEYQASLRLDMIINVIKILITKRFRYSTW